MIWWTNSGQIEFDAAFYTTTTVYRNQWVYVALSKPSGNSSASYYVNGVLVGSGSVYTTPAVTPTWFNRAAAQTWRGNCSYVQAYNRALTAQEIQQNFIATRSRYGTAPTDADADAYIAAVETADGQALEAGVKTAINDFITGCKSDGVWNSIKASCILSGARTLSGALVPLAGTAPTNNNFVSGDYNRKTGLVGDGSTKYLNSNRAGNADPQNSLHVSVYASSITQNTMIGGGGTAGRTSLVESSVRIRNTAAAISTGGNANPNTFTGGSRSSSTAVTRRINGSSFTASFASEVPLSDNYGIFARITSTGVIVFGGYRLAFYSIGESLDLALLDARVTDLINAFAAAIP